MTERPILFKGEMVRAILDGRKTQTRRAIKPVPTINGVGAIFDEGDRQEDFVEPYWVFPETCKYGAPGDLLWVRETWARHASGVDYAADFAAVSRPQAGPWRPSIHMPRWASRITLRITDIRVERLQDISEDDARAEGCDPARWIDETDVGMEGYREGFAKLWNKINGPGAWEENPWVWVVAFERVKP